MGVKERRQRQNAKTAFRKTPTKNKKKKWKRFSLLVTYKKMGEVWCISEKNKARVYQIGLDHKL